MSFGTVRAEPVKVMRLRRRSAAHDAFGTRREEAFTGPTPAVAVAAFVAVGALGVGVPADDYGVLSARSTGRQGWAARTRAYAKRWHDRIRTRRGAGMWRAGRTLAERRLTRRCRESGSRFPALRARDTLAPKARKTAHERANRVRTYHARNERLRYRTRDSRSCRVLFGIPVNDSICRTERPARSRARAYASVSGSGSGSG